MKSTDNAAENVDSYVKSDIAYLLTPAAQSRYVLAAYYVRRCDHIIEIGGRSTPITDFLTHVPRSILVLDPKMQEYSMDKLHGKSCHIRHVSEEFQSWDFDLENKNYGLVILGCSIKHFSEDTIQREREWNKLISLIDNASVTVLEYATDWRNGVDNFEAIYHRTRAQMVLQIDMDISSNNDVDTPYFLRRFVVFESKNTCT